MANHGRVGEDLERYLNRKRRPHAVSGLAIAAGSTKPLRFTKGGKKAGQRKSFYAGLKQANSHRGNGKGGSVTLYSRYVCEGR